MITQDVLIKYRPKGYDTISMYNIIIDHFGCLNPRKTDMKTAEYFMRYINKG